jgi:uncharacterized cupin superfamily protein
LSRQRRTRLYGLAVAHSAIRRLDDIPSIEDEGVDWRPIQHFFGLTAFGINVYRGDAGVQLIGDHDEAASGHEEVYLVLDGSVRFAIDGREVECGRGTVVAITEPSLHRTGIASTDGTAVLAVGNRATKRFESTWQPHHFEGVPTVDD